MMYYLLLPFQRFKTEILPMPSRIAAVFFFVLLFFLPLFSGNLYILQVVTFCCLFAIFSISWDLLSGIAGQLSFGHSAFFGVAGYTSALLNIHFAWPIGVTIPLAFAAISSWAIAVRTIPILESVPSFHNMRAETSSTDAKR